MEKYRILICSSNLSTTEMMDIEKVKEHIQKVNDPEKVNFEIVEFVRNPFRKFKEPKRKFVNKFNKNKHIK